VSARGFCGCVLASAVVFGVTNVAGSDRAYATHDTSPITLTRLPDLSGALLERYLDQRFTPWSPQAIQRHWSEDVVIFGRVVPARCCFYDAQVNLVAPSGGVIATTTTRASAFRFQFRAPESGRYSVVVVGEPPLVGAVQVNIQPTVVLTPAFPLAAEAARRVVRPRAGRRIVVSGRAHPVPVTAGRKVRLQYWANGRWNNLGTPSRISPKGIWLLRYDLRRPGHVDVRMRVVLMGPPRGVEQVPSAPFVVPVRAGR